MSIQGLKGITVNTAWEGITLSGMPAKIDQMKEIGFNLIKVDTPNAEFRNTVAFRAMLTKAHSVGVKIHIIMNISRYTGGNFNTFHTTPSARAAFMADLDFIIANYPDLDGIELEEPYLHYVPIDPAISAAARTFFNAFFSEIRTKLNSRILGGLDYGFNNATESLTSNLAMGLDVNYIATNNIFTFYDDQNSNTNLTAFTAQIALYKSRYPNLQIMEVCYLTTTTLLKNTYPGGRCSANAPGTDPVSYANPVCWNLAVFEQIKYCKDNNISLVIFTSIRLNVSGTYWTGGTVTNTPAVRIKEIFGGNNMPEPIPPGYTLVFAEEFNDLSQWNIIDNGGGAARITTANSILTMVSPKAIKANAYIEHKTKTWKYGIMEVRMKPSGMTGQRTGFWGYVNNKKQCQNYPSMPSQDSINFEFNVSGSTYNDPNGSRRVAGNLATTYSTWNDVLCSRYLIKDTPTDYLDFHTYRTLWTPTEIVIQKDGVEQVRWNTGIPVAALPIEIAINRNVSDITWIDQTPPAGDVVQEVDYIRIYQKDSTPEPDNPNSPVTIYVRYSVNEVYGEYTIEVSAIRFTGGKWLTTDNPDAEMRAYALGKIPDAIGRDLISTDIIFINGILQKPNPPKEGDIRTVKCPKNGLPIKQIFRGGQWRTLDVDVHICGEIETDYVALAIKAGVVASVLGSLLG